MQVKSILVVLLPLLALAVGWFFVLVGFGRVHQVLVLDLKFFDDQPDAYAVNFLQYWVFILLTPVAMALVLFYAATDNLYLGIFARVVLCAAAVGLGGCLAVTSAYIQSDFDIDNVRRFFILELVGGVISLLSFFALFGVLSIFKRSDNV